MAQATAHVLLLPRFSTRAACRQELQGCSAAQRSTAQPPCACFSPCVWWTRAGLWPHTWSWLPCSADIVFGNYLLFLVSARILKLDPLNNSVGVIGSRIFLPFEASETGEKSKPGVSNPVYSLTVKGNASHSKPWRCDRLVSCPHFTTLDTEVEGCFWWCFGSWTLSPMHTV